MPQINFAEVEAEIRQSCEIAIKNFMAAIKYAAEAGSYDSVDLSQHSFSDEFENWIFETDDAFLERKQPLADEDIPF